VVLNLLGGYCCATQPIIGDEPLLLSEFLAALKQTNKQTNKQNNYSWVFKSTGYPFYFISDEREFLAALIFDDIAANSCCKDFNVNNKLTLKE